MWRAIPDQNFGLLSSISEALASSERHGSLSLPDFSPADTLIVASDYAGEHSSAGFTAITFLLAAAHDLKSWERERRSLRSHQHLGARKMSFKKLSDRYRKDTIWRFLQIANAIPGALFTFLIDSKIDSLFETPPLSQSDDLLVKFKPGAREKLLRATHLLALLVAGLSHPNQDLYWFTDNDEIASNEARLRDLINCFVRTSSHLLKHDLRHFRCGTTATTDPGNLWIEDLTSIPDLASGALVELFTAYKNENTLPTKSTSNLTSVVPESISAKSRLLLHWLLDSGPLKKIVFTVDETPDGRVRSSLIRIQGFGHGSP